jgi:hypothetical protein
MGYVLLLIYYTAFHMIGDPFPRYSTPLRPFLHGLALFTLWPLVRAMRSPFKSKIDQDIPCAAVRFKAEIS